MVKSKAVEQQLGTDAKIAEASEAASANSSGWHAPGWAYAALGTLAGAVILYETVAAATALPANPLRIGRNAQPTPVVTPFVRPTPELSRYQKQALEQIALIGQKEPGLAAMLTEQVTDSNDEEARKFSSTELTTIQKAMSEKTYSLDTLVDNSDRTFIFAMSKDAYRRNTILQIIMASLPVMEQLLGINYDKPLFMAELDYPSGSLGGGGAIHIEANDWTLRNKTHETGHEIFEVYPYNFGSPILTPNWSGEGVAEFAGIYAAENFAKANPQLITFWPNYEAGKLQVTQNTVSLDKMYQEELEGVRFRTSRDQPVAGVTKGFVFLYEFRQLVGQEAFAEAMGHLYDVKVVRADVIRRNSLPSANPAWTLTDADIEGILEQHVPPAQLPEFRQLYKTRIYDLKTIE